MPTERAITKATALKQAFPHVTVKVFDDSVMACLGSEWFKVNTHDAVIAYCDRHGLGYCGGVSGNDVVEITL